MIDTQIELPSEIDPFERALCASLLDNHLHLILLPTEQCNFRCTYCYEDFAVGRMPPEIVQGVKRFIERRVVSGLESLSIAWFGGEPLIALDIVQDISAHVVALSGDHPTLKYWGEMTTNGYRLDVTTVARLRSLGIRSYQISLDGPQQCHDRTRLRANGQGSFDRIWENVTAIYQSSIDVNMLLRIHLTPANVPCMPEFLGRLRDCFLDDARFSVILKPVERMGGPHHDKIESIPVGERPRILEALKAIVRDGTDSRRLYREPNVCYAAKANSLMIRANGTLGKCTVALADPANNLGRVLPNGSLQIDNAKVRPWLRGWQSRDWSALGCPHVNFPHDNINSGFTILSE